MELEWPFALRTGDPLHRGELEDPAVVRFLTMPGSPSPRFSTVILSVFKVANENGDFFLHRTG